jgi:hypothetical protein
VSRIWFSYRRNTQKLKLSPGSFGVLRVPGDMCFLPQNYFRGVIGNSADEKLNMCLKAESFVILTQVSQMVWRYRLGVRT